MSPNPNNNGSRTFSFGESSSQHFSQDRQQEFLSQSGAASQHRGLAFFLEALKSGKQQEGKSPSAKETAFVKEVLFPLMQANNAPDAKVDVIKFIIDEGRCTERFLQEFYSGFKSNWVAGLKHFVASPSMFDFEKSSAFESRVGTKERVLALLNVMKGQQGNIEETRKNLVIKRKDGTSFFPAGFLRISAPLGIDGCKPGAIKSLVENIEGAFRTRRCNDETNCAFTKEVCSTLGIEPYHAKHIQEQFLSSVIQVVFTFDSPNGELKEEMVFGFSVNACRLPDFTDIVSEIAKAILEIKEVCKQNGKELAFVKLNLFDIFVPIDAIFQKQPSALARSIKEALDQLKRKLGSKRGSSSPTRGAEAAASFSDDLEFNESIRLKKEISMGGAIPKTTTATASSFADDSDELASMFADDLELESTRLKKEISRGAIPKTVASASSKPKLSESKIREIIVQDTKRYGDFITKEEEAVLEKMIKDFISFWEQSGKFTEAQVALLFTMENKDLIEILLLPMGIMFIETKFEKLQEAVPKTLQLIEPSAKLFFSMASAGSLLRSFLSLKGLKGKEMETENNKILKELFKKLEEKFINDYMEKA